MDIETRKELDTRLEQMSDLEIESLHLAYRRREARERREAQRHYTMMCNARKELLAREEDAVAMNTRRIGFSRALEEGI